MTTNSYLIVFKSAVILNGFVDLRDQLLHHVLVRCLLQLRLQLLHLCYHLIDLHYIQRFLRHLGLHDLSLALEQSGSGEAKSLEVLGDSGQAVVSIAHHHC